MIITKEDKNPGSPTKITYYNLYEKRAYTLVHDEFAEVSTNIPTPFTHEELEPVICRELAVLSDWIEDIKAKIKPTYEDKADLKRYESNLNYLINYEY